MSLDLSKKMRKLSLQIMHFKYLLAGRSMASFKKKYKLREEVGRGGFGIVYCGIRVDDETPVAIKFINRRYVREWGKLNDEQVPLEISLLARCAPITGVIQLLDWYSLAEGFLVVMERPLPSIDLFDFIKSEKYLNEDVARFLFRQIVQTIYECMQHHIIHRDLKDENILIDIITGEIRLIDFGAATIFKEKPDRSDFQGTRLYCPPEWFKQLLYLGEEAAVWSLGIILYNMLNGRLPFSNEKDICTSQTLQNLPFYAAVSEDAKDLVLHCLSFKHQDRCKLIQILNHRWTTVSTPDWIALIEQRSINLFRNLRNDDECCSKSHRRSVSFDDASEKHLDENINNNFIVASNRQSTQLKSLKSS